MNYDESPYYLKDFLTYLRVVRGRSERTISEYYMDLRLYLRFIKMKNENLSLDEFNSISIQEIPITYISNVTLMTVYDYLDFISSSRNNHAAARARKATSIKGFYHYLTVNAHLFEQNPVKDLEMPSLKKALPKFLTLEQSMQLLQTIQSDNIPRDYCILTLFLNCGMRLSELVGINIQDIHFEERTLRLLGKGNKERIVYINDACIDALNEYLKFRDPSSQDPNALFLSKRKTRISKRRVQQVVESALKAAGLDHQGLSTHKLRHTAATLMYQYGNVDPLILKEILGHKSIATTEIYTHVANEQMKNAADRTPLSQIKPKTISPSKHEEEK